MILSDKGLEFQCTLSKQASKIKLFNTVFGLKFFKSFKMSSESQPDERIAKCTGCGTPISDHGWGIPDKFCEGEEISSPGARAKKPIVAKEEDH